MIREMKIEDDVRFVFKDKKKSTMQSKQCYEQYSYNFITIVGVFGKQVNSCTSVYQKGHAHSFLAFKNFCL